MRRLVLLFSAVNYSVFASNCTSNLAYDVESEDDVLHVNSLNFTNCYQTELLRGRDGCGAAKGKTSSIIARFQLKEKFDTLNLQVKACPNSLNGVCIGYPVDTGNPCTNPDVSLLECPLNKGQDHIYNLKVRIALKGLLAAVIPEGETLTAKLIINGVDSFTGEERKVATISEITMGVLNENDENVVKNQIKPRAVPVCNDRPALPKSIFVDESSRRVKFKKYTVQDSTYSELHFTVKENETRRSLGRPELEITVNDDKLQIPEEQRFPCGEDTCEFIDNSEKTADDQSIRDYKIRFNKHSGLISSDQDRNSLVKIKLKGEKRRAHAEVQMPLWYYLGEESSEEVVSTIQSHTATTLAPKKSKRENRWEYNIQSYQTHIQQKSTSSSTATTMFTLVTLLFSIFIQ